MSVRLACGSLVVAAMIAPACATATGARPQPFPNLPAPSPSVSTEAVPPPVPETAVTSAPATTATAVTTSANSVSGSDGNVTLVPLSAPATAPDVPVANAKRTSPVDRTVVKRADALTKTALGLRGIKYRLGGESPKTGFDCSGLVYYVFEQHQIDVPRTVAEQFQVGEEIDLEDIQKGDLLFFSTIGKGATHVGISLGPESLGEFVHAPGAGGAVRVEHFDAPYWKSRLVGVRRIY